MTKDEIREARNLARRLFADAYGIRNNDDDRLIIDRRFWGRGAIDGGSLLKTNQLGNPSLCCLGFLCLQRGISATRIFEAGTPASVRSDLKGGHIRSVPRRLKAFIKKEADDVVPDDTDLAYALVSVNDAQIGTTLLRSTFKLANSHFKSKVLKSEAMREHLIKRLFRTAGIEVTFVN